MSSTTIVFKNNCFQAKCSLEGTTFTFLYCSFLYFFFPLFFVTQVPWQCPRVTNACLPPGLEWIRCLFNAYSIWDRLTQKALALYNTQMLSCNGCEDGGGHEHVSGCMYQEQKSIEFPQTRRLHSQAFSAANKFDLHLFYFMHSAVKANPSF